MLFVDKEDYLTDFEKKTRDDDYLDHYLKNPNAPGIVQVKLELRQLFYGNFVFNLNSNNCIVLIFKILLRLLVQGWGYGS